MTDPELPLWGYEFSRETYEQYRPLFNLTQELLALIAEMLKDPYVQVNLNLPKNE